MASAIKFPYFLCFQLILFYFILFTIPLCLYLQGFGYFFSFCIYFFKHTDAQVAILEGVYMH